MVYNPSYSINVKTNIDKVSFKLLHKYFSKTHKFYKYLTKTLLNSVIAVCVIR